MGLKLAGKFVLWHRSGVYSISDHNYGTNAVLGTGIHVQPIILRVWHSIFECLPSSLRRWKVQFSLAKIWIFSLHGAR